MTEIPPHLKDLHQKMAQHREWEEKLKNSNTHFTLPHLIHTQEKKKTDAKRDYIERLALRDFEKAFTKSEDDLKALQSVGQIVGEVLKNLGEENGKLL